MLLISYVFLLRQLLLMPFRMAHFTKVDIASKTTKYCTFFTLKIFRVDLAEAAKWLWHATVLVIHELFGLSGPTKKGSTLGSSFRTLKPPISSFPKASLKSVWQ